MKRVFVLNVLFSNIIKKDLNKINVYKQLKKKVDRKSSPIRFLVK